MYSSNHRPGQPDGLTRYVSAPGSLLANMVDSVIGSDDGDEFSNIGSETHHLMVPSSNHQYFSADSSSLTNESDCKPNNNNGISDFKQVYRNESGINGNTTTTTTANGGLHRSYGLNQIDVGDFQTASNLRCGGAASAGGGGSSSLLRHSSSPAGFFNHLMVENGFSITNGVGGYTKAGTNTVSHGRLKTQLSFTQDSLSQISEVSESIAGVSSSDEVFTMGSWEDGGNAIFFSDHSNKRAKNNNGDTVTTSEFESGSLFNLPRLQNDSVQCKIRAKRGFATHPRSIAERERRGRISENLRKLQELVPNMDKQTSTADMLDLAVQHIKGLQGEVQKLNKDLESCTCGCKQSK